jgi:hypothetical protein
MKVHAMHGGQQHNILPLPFLFAKCCAADVFAAGLRTLLDRYVYLRSVSSSGGSSSSSSSSSKEQELHLRLCQQLYQSGGVPFHQSTA